MVEIGKSRCVEWCHNYGRKALAVRLKAPIPIATETSIACHTHPKDISDTEHMPKTGQRLAWVHTGRISSEALFQ